MNTSKKQVQVLPGWPWSAVKTKFSVESEDVIAGSPWSLLKSTLNCDKVCDDQEVVANWLKGKIENFLLNGDLPTPVRVWLESMLEMGNSAERRPPSGLDHVDNKSDDSERSSVDDIFVDESTSSSVRELYSQETEEISDDEEEEIVPPSPRTIGLRYRSERAEGVSPACPQAPVKVRPTPPWLAKRLQDADQELKTPTFIDLTKFASSYASSDSDSPPKKVSRAPRKAKTPLTPSVYRNPKCGGPDTFCFCAKCAPRNQSEKA